MPFGLTVETINRGLPRLNSSHHSTPLSPRTTPPQSRIKASSASQEFHRSPPPLEKKGAIDFVHPRSCRDHPRVRRRRLRRSHASPTLACTPVIPQQPPLAALGFYLAGVAQRRR